MWGRVSQVGRFSFQCDRWTSSCPGTTWELIRNVEWQVSPKPTESESAFKQNPWMTPVHTEICEVLL